MTRHLSLLFAAAMVLTAAEGQPFSWRGSVPIGQTLEVKGVNGEIRVELATGSQIEVNGRIHSRRSDPNSVRVEVVPRAGGDVTICAIYQTDEPSSNCEQRGNIRNNDTKVDFTVRLPRGVKIQAKTVNGQITAQRLQSPVIARTVNGGIRLSTTETADAKTVNGEIEADMGQIAARTQFETVNGGITLGLPPTVNADINASVVNGGITPDFPLTVSGNISSKRLNGKVGGGGPEILIKTVNGNIQIRRAGAA